jgi:Ser/Thr protein kinase RdoA (MazF antagonist)
VEVAGRRATGYALALNSLENRVYEVELEDGERLVVKFYRPGRWSREAILDEHAFLRELADEDVPVVPPLVLEEGGAGATLRESPTESGTLLYAVFPKVRGRVPEELFDPQLEELGRLLARLHLVGGRRRAASRPELTADSYGTESIARLAAGPFIPPELRPRFVAAATRLVDTCRPALAGIEPIRLHGDCHLGNLLFAPTRENPLGAPFFVDFDDFLHGPPVQDLWLLAPGRDDEARAQRALVAEAYDSMRPFDMRTLRLVEPLRALRILRYAGWIAARWDDPAFQRTFPSFLEASYWQREIAVLEEQQAHVEHALAGG